MKPIAEALELAMRRTDPDDPHALERDAEQVCRVLVRHWADDAPRVAARALELARDACSDPDRFRALRSPRPPSTRRRGGGGPSGPVENPDSGAGTTPRSADPDPGGVDPRQVAMFAPQEGEG